MTSAGVGVAVHLDGFTAAGLAAHRALAKLPAGYALPTPNPTLPLAWPAHDHLGGIVVAMRRALTLILGVALFGILAAVVVAAQGADDPAGTTGTVTETVERTTTVEDIPNRVRDDNDAQGEDISGPCDEAEHANDPRCTGTPANPPGKVTHTCPPNMKPSGTS